MYLGLYNDTCHSLYFCLIFISKCPVATVVAMKIAIRTNKTCYGSYGNGLLNDMSSKKLLSLYSPFELSVRPSSVLTYGPLYFKFPKLGVWLYLGAAECQLLFSGHCDLDL